MDDDNKSIKFNCYYENKKIIEKTRELIKEGKKVPYLFEFEQSPHHSNSPFLDKKDDLNSKNKK